MHVNSLYLALLAGLCFIYLGLMAYAHFFAHKLIFPAPAATYEDGPEILWLKLPDGSPVAAQYFPCPGASFTVIYSHGNGEDLGMAASRIAQCASRGYNMITYDYPGYGLSQGPATQARCYAAARAVYDHVHKQLGVSPEHIVIYGYSVGGGPAVELAAQVPARALIVEATFTSCFRVMTHIKVLPWDVFDNLKKMPHVRCPVLVIHGKQDNLIPFKHGLKLFAAARSPKAYLWIEGAGHFSTLEMGGDTYWQALDTFLAGAFGDCTVIGASEANDMPCEKTISG